MLKKQFETKNIPTEVLIGVERQCDICGKEITEPYWHTTSNIHSLAPTMDTILSKLTSDICNEECMHKWFEKYIKYSANKFQIGDVNIEYIVKDYELKHELDKVFDDSTDKGETL